LQAHTPAHTLAAALLSPANDEIRITNDERMTKSEWEKFVLGGASSFEHSDFLRHSAFVLRH
ncbi:MAG: hypothetical protein DME76_06895, partial [Verrucomicrobia bacterium]